MDKNDDLKRRKTISNIAIILIFAILLLNSGMFTIFDKRTIKIPECDAIRTTIDRDNCHSDRAIKDNNPDLCDNMGFERARSNCLIFIATSLQNITICDKIKEQPRKEMCIFTLSLGNPIIEERPPCSSYTDEIVRTICDGNMSH